ncbi:MAG TPA: DUF6789 family protein [Acidimicrobiales bacterium]
MTHSNPTPEPTPRLATPATTVGPAATAGVVQQLGAAAVFFTSGGALVVHILTDATLPIVFAGLLVGGGILALRARPDPAARAGMVPVLKVGLVAGLVSTVVYDLSRYAIKWAFHLHASPFKALPYFGEALVGAEAGSTASWVAGVVFHVTNGVCFGIGYTVLAGRRPLPWAVAFGLGLEACMLALYPSWLQIAAMREFTEISLLGHVAYGVTLGLVTNRLLPASSTPSEQD